MSLVNINLLPKHLRRRLGPDWWRVSAIAVPLIVLGTVAYITLTVQNTLNEKINTRDQLQAEVNLLKPYIQEQRKLERKKKELEQIAVVAREVQSTYRPWSLYLSSLIQKLPRTSKGPILSLNFIDAHTIKPDRAQRTYGFPARVEFSLRGEAASEQALVEFVKAFETDRRFGINFQSSSRETKTGIYTFRATVGMAAPKADRTENARERNETAR